MPSMRKLTMKKLIMKKFSSPLVLFALMLPLAACADTPTPASDPKTGNTFVVYANGVFNWPGDYSYAANINYKDTKGKPETGTYDLSVSLSSPWGAWQPFGPNWNFDLRPYNYLQFDLKPTAANQQWDCFALMVGDKNIVDTSGKQVVIDINKYGPAPQAGVWATYKIPLAAIMTHQGVQLKAMYKFDIHDQTGQPANVFYVNNVKFTAN